MRRAYDSLGKTEDKMKGGQQRVRWFNSIINSVDMNLSKFWEIVKDREAWHAAVHGVAKRQSLATEQQKKLYLKSIYSLG